MSQLTKEHDELVHSDGSVCEDGCDAQPVKDKRYERMFVDVNNTRCRRCGYEKEILNDNHVCEECMEDPSWY